MTIEPKPLRSIELIDFLTYYKEGLRINNPPHLLQVRLIFFTIPAS
jgi:hypothetical protein